MGRRTASRQQLRAERRERERAEHARRHRLRRLRLAAGGALLAVIAAATAAALAIGGGASGRRAAAAAARPAIVPSQLLGMSGGAAPWAPDSSGLVQRLATLRLPAPSDVAYHVHALLHVYVGGRPVPVPAEIGVDQRDGVLAPLHTHDASGVIHMEAVRPFPFRLADVFDVWGVVLTPTQLGGYRDAGAERVHVYVNGRPLRTADPTRYVLRPHDNVVVAYGRDGSFPTRPSTAALAGL